MCLQNCKNITELCNHSDNLDKLNFLPLCHTFLEEDFYKYYGEDNGILNPEGCDVFEEDLIYLFYGNAYFTKESKYKDQNLGVYPYTLIYDVNTLIDAGMELKRLYPFDSGRFEKYRLSPYKLRQYEIHNPKFKHLASLAYGLFGSNDEYLTSKYQFQENKVYEMIKPLDKLIENNNNYINKKGGPFEYGKQAFTFEVQLSTKIETRPIAIAIPDDEQDTYLSYCQENNFTIIPYNTEDNQETAKLYEAMQVAIKDYIKSSLTNNKN